MKKTVLIIGMILGMIASVAIYANSTENGEKRPFRCGCRWIGQTCSAAGWGITCAPDGQLDCWSWSKNCQKNLEEDN